MAILNAGLSIFWIRDWIRNSEPWKESDSGFESLKNQIFEKLMSEMETRELLGGTEENSVSPMRGH